ncbi:UNVERIFIED_CONTAM: hypothetical protein Sradi_6917300 [Sesamum radiatum]|uniref:Uncharacterized protein n=1 Tax=Sesamum radiatum TaxID=300843 RepID=A0AAW2JHZ2_SESRA
MGFSSSIQNCGIYGGSHRGGALALSGTAGGAATVGTRNVTASAKTFTSPGLGPHSALTDGILDGGWVECCR